jgi:peptide/nickel transport system ATP-binding protein
MKLELRDLSVRYGVGSAAFTAVDRVSLAVPEGETAGVVGESGCGKSTLARAAVGLVPLASGRILLDGVDRGSPGARAGSDYHRRVQMVFQDPYASLNPRATVRELLHEIFEDVVHTRAGDRGPAARRLLDMVGLPVSALDRYPHQFSGGQRQRIAIARALAVEPEVIILDEVTSSLDVSVQATILNLLRGLQRDLGLSYVFISHDLATVRYMSNDINVMYLGRVVERAPRQELFDHPAHPYTRALIGSIPRFGSRNPSAPLTGDLPDPHHPPAGCRFSTRCPVGPRADPTRTICREQDPQAGAEARPHAAACHFADPGSAGQSRRKRSGIGASE